MAAVSGAIPNLVGGVSQQPPEIRAINTSERLVNTWSDVVTGLSTRPHGEYSGQVSNAPAAGKTVATHDIHKPSGSYRVSIHGGSIFVTNLKTGVAQTVNIQAPAGSYISVDDAAANLGFLTIGDTTFIWNKTKVVTKSVVAENGLTGATIDGVVRLNPNRYSTVWVKQRAGYNANYSIYYNDVLKANFVTADGTPSSIATDLTADMTGAGLSSALISKTVISTQLPNETDYLVAQDDFGNNALFSYNDFVDEFTDLPNFDRTGRLVLVRQEMGNPKDDYWVWYAAGEWSETVGWKASETITASTMPHVLVDNGNGTWTLKQHTWEGRKVGDFDSNPTPSFVGQTIRHMMLHKGRMVILSGENSIGSQVGFYENFYRSTCTQLLDEDPFDIASPSSKGAELNYAMEFDGALLLFSKFDQFRIEGDNEGNLSPNTVTIKKVNSYNAAPKATPAFVGPNILFVDDFDNGGYAKLREYQIDRSFGRQVAPSVTDAIPDYIPSGVYQIAGSSTDDIIVLLTTGDRNRVWLYNYYFNSEGKVQSAWQLWEFPFTVWGAGFVDDHLVLTVSYNGKLHLLTFNFDSGADKVLDRGSIALDFRTSLSTLAVSYDGRDTTVTLPYTLASDADLSRLVAVVVPGNTGPLLEGKTYEPVSRSGATIKFTNVDLRGNDVEIGWTYEFDWTLNPIYMRDRNLVAIQDGRLQLRGLSLLYSNSGPFKALVTPPGRPTFTKVNSGFVIGSSDDRLNRLSLNSGSFAISAPGESHRVSIRIVAKTPWRVRFSSMEWNGAYQPKRKRTT